MRTTEEKEGMSAGDGKALIPQDFLEAIAIEQGVSDTELEVLSFALRGESTLAIAQKLGTRAEVIRNRLREVYKKFQIPGAGPGKLAKLQQLLVSKYQAHQTQPSFDTNTAPIQPKGATAQPHRDWGEAPNVSIFYGRTEERATLEQWIVEEGCRLVALLGMEGIGKTALSVKLAQQTQDKFEYLIWRSLRQAPPVNDLVVELLQLLSDPSSLYLLEVPNTLISELIKAFQKHRCLLVLDNFETILQSGELVGQYREGYEGYGELLRRIGEETHKSCLVLTSLERPREISRLAGNTLPVRSWSLKGLKEEDAREILKARGLSGENKWKTLIQLYRGNPLALKLVATTIEELFNGQVAEFVGRGMLVFGELQDLLDEPFKRLSPLEKEIMYWLAIEDQPLSLITLQADFWLPVQTRDLFEALTSLGRRSLVETSAEGGESRFGLQPVVMQYVTNQLAEQFSEEINGLLKDGEIEKTKLFRSLALSKALEKGNKTAQTPSLLKQVTDTLRAIFRSESKIIEPLQQLLAGLKGKPQLEVGYASENVLQLLQELNAPEVQDDELLHQSLVSRPRES